MTHSFYSCLFKRTGMFHDLGPRPQNSGQGLRRSKASDCNQFHLLCDTWFGEKFDKCTILLSYMVHHIHSVALIPSCHYVISNCKNVGFLFEQWFT